MRKSNHKYNSEFIKSIHRKALYKEPLFLIDVQFTNDSNKVDVQNASSKNKIDGGNKSANIIGFPVEQPIELKFSKELIRNLYEYVDKSFESKKIISILFRQLLLDKYKFKTVLASLYPLIIENYRSIAFAYTDKIDESAIFPFNIMDLCKNLHKKSILLIDFDVTTDEQSKIAAILKQIYFGLINVSNGHSKQSIMEYIKTANYTIIADIQITFATDIIQPYGLLISK